MIDFIHEWAIPLIVAGVVIGFGLGLFTVGLLFSIREGSDK
jgi:hypothetical protein